MSTFGRVSFPMAAYRHPETGRTELSYARPPRGETMFSARESIDAVRDAVEQFRMVVESDVDGGRDPSGIGDHGDEPPSITALGRGSTFCGSSPS